MNTHERYSKAWIQTIGPYYYFQKCQNSKIKKFKKFKNAKIQKLKNFKNSKIQKFKN